MFDDQIVDSKRIQYTASDFAKESLLYLQEAGNLVSLKKHKASHSKLNSYLFFCILKGEGKLVYKEKNYTLKQGDCVFIDCLEKYSHTASSSSWNIQWVHFNGPSMKNIYNKYTSRGGEPVFQPNNLTKYLTLLDKIYEVASNDDYIRDMRINSLLSELLSLIMEMSCFSLDQITIKRGNSQFFSLQDVKNEIDDNWNKKLTLDGLSKQFSINKYYLERIFRRQYGRTIIAYIIEKRITHSKQLLRFSDSSIEKIAFDCGFEDANYFSRKFKAIEGISPGEFRKKWTK